MWEMIAMSEDKPKDGSPVAPPQAPAPAAGAARQHPASEAGPPATIPETANAPAAEMAAAAEMNPLENRTWRASKTPMRVNLFWIALPAVLLLAILAFFFNRSGPKAGKASVATVPTAGETEPELSNYSAFVAKNKALIEKRSEQVLSDEPFAGQAPLAAAVNGPLVSADIDPQLAVLADALRIRVRVMQGSQSFFRDNGTTRVIRGEFRGFKVQAVEKLKDGNVLSEEVTVTTPKNGTFKTVNRVLVVLQKTDSAKLFAEVGAAGMEFTSLPVPAGERSFRGQLRLLRAWGPPISGDRLVSGESVGRVALGMPVDQLQNRIAATDSILKRKVWINDVYHDVYKVSDQGGNPLFFVYEKEGKVQGIWVVSESFKTAQGVGIGSSLEQMRIHYSAVTLSRSEKKVPFVKVEGVDGNLIIQGAGDRKVVAILIGDSPEFN